MRVTKRLAVALTVLISLVLAVHAENANVTGIAKSSVELSLADQELAVLIVAKQPVVAYMVALSDLDYSCRALETGIPSDDNLYAGVLCTPLNATTTSWIVYALVQFKPDAKVVAITMDRPGVAKFKRDLMLRKMGLSKRDVDGLRGRSCRRGIWCLMRQILDRESDTES